MHIAQRTRQAIGYLVLAACIALLLIRGSFDMAKASAPAGDFQTVYGMTRCMLENCDPYDADQIRSAFLRNGGVLKDGAPFRPHEPLYLPPALVATVPFAVMPWQQAHILWLAVIVTSFLVGVFLIAGIGRGGYPVLTFSCLGLVVLNAASPLVLGQPAMLAVGLAAIAVWSFIEGKATKVGVLCLALSLVYKPHVSGLVWLYFLLADRRYRKLALRTLLVAIFICIIGVLWASLMPHSAGWVGELQANIAGMTGRGMPADPGPLNHRPGGASNFLCLQSIVSLFKDDPRLYNSVAHLIGGVILLIWLYPVMRMRPGREKDFLAIASVACISLLPVYHPWYDSCVLLLTLPAFALSLAGTLRLRAISFMLVFVAFVLVQNKYQAFIFEHLVRPMLPLGRWGTILWLRQLPIVISALAVFFLIQFYRAIGQQKATASHSPAE